MKGRNIHGKLSPRNSHISKSDRFQPSFVNVLHLNQRNPDTANESLCFQVMIPWRSHRRPGLKPELKAPGVLRQQRLTARPGGMRLISEAQGAAEQPTYLP
jgi:hypothetical protein